MKKLLYTFIILLLASCSVTMAQTSTETEVREYAIDIVPGELYFMETKAFSQGSYNITNELAYMWYPSRVESWFGTAANSTNSLAHVYKNTVEYFLDYRVVTNDFGNVATNYLHGLTNTVTTYVTNTIATWTNTTASTRAYAEVDDIQDYFIQKGDILQFSIGITNACRTRLVGSR